MTIAIGKTFFRLRLLSVFQIIANVFFKKHFSNRLKTKTAIAKAMAYLLKKTGYATEKVFLSATSMCTRLPPRMKMMNLAKTFCAEPLEADIGRSGYGPIVAGLTD